MPGKGLVGTSVESGAGPPPSAAGFVHRTSRSVRPSSPNRSVRAPPGRPKTRVGRRRLVEDRVGDHAACPLARPAGRDPLERAAAVPSALDEHVPAEQHRGHQAAAGRLEGLDHLADQVGEHPSALGVPDEDDAAPLVVPARVLEPGGADVPIGELEGLARERGLVDPRQGELPVHRREDAAALREARRLVAGDRELLGVHAQVRVDARVLADGRVDVEAVDPAAAGQRRVLHRGGPVRRDRGCLQAAVAGVRLDARLAEPDGLGRRGGRARPRQRGESAERRQQREGRPAPAVRSVPAHLANPTGAGRRRAQGFFRGPVGYGAAP